MIYRVFRENPKSGKKKKDNDYDTLEKAEKRKEDLKKGTGRAKGKKEKYVSIGVIPEYIGYNYVIYRPNGEVYGTIANIPNKYFWYVIPVWKTTESELEYPFFIKATFEQKFLDGVFKAVDGDPSVVIVPTIEELEKLGGLGDIDIQSNSDDSDDEENKKEDEDEGDE